MNYLGDGSWEGGTSLSEFSWWWKFMRHEFTGLNSLQEWQIEAGAGHNEYM